MSIAGVFVDWAELAAPKALAGILEERVDDAVPYSDGPVCHIVVLVSHWSGSGTLLAPVVRCFSVSFAEGHRTLFATPIFSS